MDNVDKIVKQWHLERPDLDVSSMELIGRFKQITQRLSQGMAKTFAQHGLNPANFDVLATLRRSGSPYALTPNDLISSTMVTSGTMTNRIDQLTKAGLVERVQSLDDRRSFLISLTKPGFELIDSILKDHVATQDKLTSSLSNNESQQLNSLLRTFLMNLEGE